MKFCHAVVLLLCWVTIPVPLSAQTTQDSSITQGATESPVLTQITDIVESHTRVVWVQDQSKNQDDSLARGRNLKLMGFDSLDGRGERELSRQIKNYAKPLIVPDGSAVIFSDHFSHRVWLHQWETGEQREVCQGFALDVWADPNTGVTWVYVATRGTPRENYVYKNLRRVRLDDPRISEPIWDVTAISPDNFQLSADGTKAAGELPWPNGSLADLTRHTYQKRATGCWSSLAPDNSGLMAVFDGPHRHWQMSTGMEGANWKVTMNSAAKMGGNEMFHPRWSNHVRYLVLTGPYSVKGTVNYITGGGPGIEIWMGRFAPDFRSIDAWYQVTHNQRGDFYPDLWIKGGEASRVPVEVTGRPPIAADTRPQSDRSIAFAWKNSFVDSQLPLEDGTIRPCQFEAVRAAFFDRHGAMQLSGGGFRASAGWNEGWSSVNTQSNWMFGFVITPESIAKSAKGTIMSLSMPDEPTDNPREPRDDSADGASNTQSRMSAKPGSAILRLFQNGPRLQYELLVRQGEKHKTIRFGAGELGGTSPHWIGISVSDDEICTWNQGVLVERKRIPYRPDLLKRATDLSFGQLSAAASKDEPWRGRIEDVKLIGANVSTNQMESEFKQLSHNWAQRRPPERAVIKGRIEQITSIPTLESIVPYRRALVVHEVSVKDRILGILPAKRILIARWAILDGIPVRDAVPKVGTVSTFRLELLADHPELESERQIMETDQLDLPLYYEMEQPIVLE